MPKAIVGRKLGMTQIFTPEGECVAVTVVKVGPCTVVRKKSAESKDGYNAIVLGFEEARSAEFNGEKVYKLNKPELGVYKAAGVDPCKSLHEVRVWESDLAKYEVGQKVNADIFVAGEVFDVIGTSKGSGFTGVMKRHNFGGAKRYDLNTRPCHEEPQNGRSVRQCTRYRSESARLQRRCRTEPDPRQRFDPRCKRLCRLRSGCCQIASSHLMCEQP